MQRDKGTDDFKYLSDLGFENTATGKADLNDLVKQVRSKSFSPGRESYFTFLSVLVGVFMGLSLFFVFYEAPPGRIKYEADSVLSPKDPDVHAKPALIELDTVILMNENFISVRARKNQARGSVSIPQPSSAIDSVVSLPSPAIELEQPVKEEKLKFIVNAPVFYIHNMKITDYTTLYFKRNQFVPVGTTARFANKQEANESSPNLKQSADYFLHEELGAAMLEFKKERYDRCINSLNLVATYNQEDLNCDFYLGMCYFYKRSYAKAISLLDLCIGNLNNTFLQEAMYYKAVCLFENGEKPKAMELFKQIADEGEFYAEKAKKFL